MHARLQVVLWEIVTGELPFQRLRRRLRYAHFLVIASLRVRMQLTQRADLCNAARSHAYSCHQSAQLAKCDCSLLKYEFALQRIAMCFNTILFLLMGHPVSCCSVPEEASPEVQDLIDDMTESSPADRPDAPTILARLQELASASSTYGKRPDGAHPR